MNENKKKNMLKRIIIAFLLFLIIWLVLKRIPDRLPSQQKVIMWENNTLKNKNTIIYNIFENKKPPKITENLISLSNREDENCISNVTRYNISGVEEDFMGYLIDDCDTKIIEIPPELGEQGLLFFWIMPLWNRTKNKTYYLLEIGESKDRNRISILVDESNYLIFRIIYDSGTSYKSALKVNFWDNYEWGFIVLSWNWDKHEINSYFGIEDFSNLFNTKFSLENIYFDEIPNVQIGSDIDGENQADSFFSSVEGIPTI